MDLKTTHKLNLRRLNIPFTLKIRCCLTTLNVDDKCTWIPNVGKSDMKFQENHSLPG